MCNNELQIRIDGLPKNFSIHKLTKLLNRQTKSWKLEYLIPLEEYIIANIVCETKESYDCFLKITEIAPFSSYPNIRVYNASLVRDYVEQIYPDCAPNNSIFKLNLDCLRLVFAKCNLPDQISLAKEELHLNDEEIWDFSILSGPYVRAIAFNTIFTLDFAQKFTVSGTKTVVETGKCQINIWMCRHLVHFPHVRRFKVLGFLFDEFTVGELARYCPQLSEFTMLDICCRFVSGKKFRFLRNLEVLELPVCQNVRRTHMLKICKQVKLKVLNIVENRQLRYAPFLKQIFALQFTSLKELWLTAISNQSLIATILELPHLKKLKFYWIDNYVSFEKMLFIELYRKRRNSLYALCWETEPPFLLNESCVQWQEGEYEQWREEAHFNGCAWQSFENYTEWMNLVFGCTAIKTMTFRYTRILTYEYILELPEIAKSLENIQFVGCRQILDDILGCNFIEQSISSCQLSFQGPDWYDVMEMRRPKRRFRRGHESVYRSILCTFK